MNDRRYQDINAETIDRWVSEGWEWGKPIDSMTRTLRTGRLCRFRRSGTSRSRTMSFIAGKGARRHKGTGGPT